MEPPVLVNLDIAQLCAQAGGDPWKLNDEVQAGDPAEINNLADAFHNSLACIEETDANWVQAKQRFQQAYQHDGGSRHPINESAEVIATTEQLHLQRGQVEQIAVGLETIATALATAQTDSEAALAWPNVALHFLDEAISAAEADGQDTTAYYNSAVTVVREALDEITGIRATYTTVLSTQEAVMTASTGYHPQVIDDFDGAADDDPTPAAQRYDQTHRDADQALVDHAQQTGEWTDDARAAAARLRDSATVADPDAPAEARRLAGERLDDYNNATFIGPLPQDTVLGGDARSTARTRLALQRQLEAGEFAPGYKAMTADEATKLLDQVEAKARVNALRGLQLQLQQAGMTPEGAAKVVDGIAQGTVPQEYVDAASAAGSAFGAGEDAIKKFSELVPTGRHWGPGTAFSADDIKALGRLGGRVGFVGNVIDLGNAVYDLTHGVSPAEVAAKTGGGMLGAWSYGTLGMTAGGFIAGPPGAFIGALLLGTYGSIKGQEAGEKALHWVTE